MHERNLLTIAIPTYNRLNQLSVLVNSLIEYQEKFEIIISDNNSYDGTYEYCKLIESKFNNVTYVKNNVNIGYDLNVLNCLKHCKTDYIWFLSDDDFVVKNVIEGVISFIDESHFDALLINSVVINASNNSLISENLNGVTNDRIFTVEKKDIIEFIYWGTLISSIIIKSSIIDMSNLNEHIGLEFVQHGILWRSVLGKRLIVSGSLKICKFDGNKDNFNSHSALIWTKNWINSIWSLKDIYGKENCMKAAATLYNRIGTSNIVMHFFVARAYNLLSRKDVHDLRKRIEISKFHDIILIILSLLPSVVILIFYRIAKLLKTIFRKILQNG